MKKVLTLVLVSFLLILALTGCAGDNTGEENDTLRVALIGNQKFGDNGPMDDMAAGGERAAAEFGVEFKTLESSPATFEDDIRAMSNEGYDLIITTFYYMSEATATVAQEFPDTKYCAIFQKINGDDTSISNLWDMEFRGQTTFYVDGYMAGLTTQTGKIGIIVGGEEPGPNNEANAFMRGVRDANPDATVEFSFASYEDTALVKEVAVAMIEKGVDIIQGDCGSADSGIVEAANEAGNVMVLSCICDFSDSCEYFAGSILMSYGECTYDAIKALVDGTFTGGTTTSRDITNRGYYLEWSLYENFAAKETPFQESWTSAIEKGKELEASIIDGSLVIDFDGEYPSWERISAEA